ncbi:MAG TPA: hypothetical protein VFF06_02285 [Polyangia bacterium]|nr:hypothetical protein [Polyangia bacterium]
MKRVSKIFVLLAGLAGCGGGVHIAPSSGPSCSGTQQGIQFCVDFLGATAAQFADLENGCVTQLNGTFSSGPCDRNGVVAGCLANSTPQEVTWFYSDSGLTPSQVQKVCSQQNQTFATP